MPMTATGGTHQQITRSLGSIDKTVRKWQSRCSESTEALVTLESQRKAAGCA